MSPRSPGLGDTSPMASANLELVRSIYTYWDRADWRLGEWTDPEMELAIADGPDPASWTGLRAITAGWRDFLSTWQGYRAEAQEYREIDGERVYVLIRISGRGKTSGVEMGNLAANLFTLRSGKVTRLVIYWDPENALADLGLAPR